MLRNFIYLFVFFCTTLLFSQEKEEILLAEGLIKLSPRKKPAEEAPAAAEEAPAAAEEAPAAAEEKPKE